MQDLNAEINLELADLAVEVSKSMVRLEVAGNSFGTGTVWHEDGLVITNAHVAASHLLTAVLQDGGRFPANVIGIDRAADVAALQIDAETDLQPIPIGDARSLRPGELVFAMGFPWGIGSGLTIGSVIGITAWPDRSGGDSRTWLAASLHLRPGHSGGPMFNASGELVGMNTVMQGPDVGVAVPAYAAVSAIHKMLA